ncbi:MAG: hypothetical protein ACSHXJ_07945 [Marinomonas colpomeniae]
MSQTLTRKRHKVAQLGLRRMITAGGFSVFLQEECGRWGCEIFRFHLNPYSLGVLAGGNE